MLCWINCLILFSSVFKRSKDKIWRKTKTSGRCKFDMLYWMNAWPCCWWPEESLGIDIHLISFFCFWTVDPPEDLVIFDPGHLGHLEIRWSPPARLINKTECPKHYQLEYFSTYKGGWTVSADTFLFKWRKGKRSRSMHGNEDLTAPKVCIVL